MASNIVSECHSVRLFPAACLAGFSKVSSKVRMLWLIDPVELPQVPGSVRVTSTCDGGVVSKTLAFECPDITPRTSTLLDALGRLRLVATYVDECGNTRVCGSPQWPLGLTYTCGGGVFSVRLTGEDTGPDGFLVN